MDINYLYQSNLIGQPENSIASLIKGDKKIWNRRTMF